MDTAYLHLITNHIPIIGIPFALVLLIAGIWLKSDEIKAFGLLAFAILGVLTLGVYLLGQGGEDFVEDLAGVSHDAIEDHEKMGLISLISVGITAILSLSGLIFYKGFSLLRRKEKDESIASGETAGEEVEVKRNSIFPKWLIFAVLLLALLSTGILGYTGKLGGKIRHTEFYGGATDTNTESDTEEKDEENGKGRGRNRGGRK